MSDKKKVSDTIMVFVGKNIQVKEDLGDLSKGDLVSMLYQISNRVDYWQFVEDSKVFEEDL